MVRVTIVAASLLLLAPKAAAATSINRWRPFITEASARYGIPQAWIRRVIAAESGGRTMLAGRPTVSPAGAMGLMQLMPGTWAELRRSEQLGTDPHDPRDNILAGTAYLRAMYDRFGYPGLFSAYNAGPARYARHLRLGTPLPLETVRYVRQVAGTGPGRGGLVEAAPGEDRAAGLGLFAIQAAAAGASSRPAPIAGNALFVPLGLPPPAQ